MSKILDEAEVIIMRGLPGSGKTTWVKNRFGFKPFSVYSADHYFELPDGSYFFDPKKLSKAHGECLQRFVLALENPGAYGHPLVVDNTNLFALDMAPYVALAQAYEKKWCIVTIYESILTAFNRNIHGIDEVTFRKKVDYFSHERLPKFWLPHHVEVGVDGYRTKNSPTSEEKQPEAQG